MHSSPLTPSGTTSPERPSRRIRVFATGRPMVTGPPSATSTRPPVA